LIKGHSSPLLLLPLTVYREKHIYTKIEVSKREAVMKKKKNDQKGSISSDLFLSLFLSYHRSDLCSQEDEDVRRGGQQIARSQDDFGNSNRVLGGSFYQCRGLQSHAVRSYSHEANPWRFVRFSDPIPFHDCLTGVPSVWMTSWTRCKRSRSS
jgi:hypothetical protein